jgi:hypothetical protein
MRFIVMHKVDASMEAGERPNQSIITQMGELVGGSLKSGVFENGAGLHRSATRTRVTFRGGRSERTDGPLVGKNELIDSVLMVKVGSREEAIAQAERVAAIVKDGEIEVGPVVEAWDIGVMPKPANQTEFRFLLLIKGDAKSERGEADPAQRAALATLRSQMKDEGVLLAAEQLAPTSRGARLPPASAGQRRWVDGPFAESKELIAGFSILNLPDKAAALAWADRYAAILVENEIDLRELVG